MNLTAKKIKAIRKKYGLPASKMSSILGFGINQWREYEQGGVPSKSNANLIYLASFPKNFMTLVKISFLDESEKESIIKQIERLKSDSFSKTFRIGGKQVLIMKSYIEEHDKYEISIESEFDGDRAKVRFGYEDEEVCNYQFQNFSYQKASKVLKEMSKFYE